MHENYVNIDFCSFQEIKMLGNPGNKGLTQSMFKKIMETNGLSVFPRLVLSIFYKLLHACTRPHYFIFDSEKSKD